MLLYQMEFSQQIVGEGNFIFIELFQLIDEEEIIKLKYPNFIHSNEI